MNINLGLCTQVKLLCNLTNVKLSDTLTIGGQTVTVVVQQIVRLDHNYVFLCLAKDGVVLKSSLWSWFEMDEILFWRTPSCVLKPNLRSKTSYENSMVSPYLSPKTENVQTVVN